MEVNRTLASVNKAGPDEVRDSSSFTGVGNVTTLRNLDIFREAFPDYLTVSEDPAQPWCICGGPGLQVVFPKTAYEPFTTSRTDSLSLRFAWLKD